MATKPNDNTRKYWKEKKREWRKENPEKDKEYERKNTNRKKGK